MKPKQPYRSYSAVVATPAPVPQDFPRRPYYQRRPQKVYNPNNLDPLSYPKGTPIQSRHNQVTSSRFGSGRFGASGLRHVDQTTFSRPQPYVSKKTPKTSWKKFPGGEYENSRTRSFGRKTRVETQSGPVDLLEDDFEIDVSQLEKVLNLVSLHSHCNVRGNECQINDTSSCGTEIHQKRLDKMLCQLSSGTPLPAETDFIKVKHSQCNYS